MISLSPHQCSPSCARMDKAEPYPTEHSASLGARDTGQQEHQGRVPIEGALVGRVTILVVQITFGGRSPGRQVLEGRVLPGGIGSSGEESRPRLRDAIASTGPVMGMAIGVLSHLGYPGERECISTQQVVQVIQGGVDIGRLDRKSTCLN